MHLKPFNPDKELKKTNRKYTKKQLIITLLVLVVMITIGSSYAIFSIQPEYHTFVKSQVGEFSTGDIKLSVLVEGVAQSDFPAKGTGYSFEKVECENGSTGTWDATSWQLTLSSKGPDKCIASFVEGEYRDNSGASMPELYNGLIPINYDNNNNILVADVYDKWYDYDNHEWANAILIDQSNTNIKNKYLNSDGSYKYGVQVDIGDILQMYVWIPRYRYKLFNVSGALSSAQIIEIIFESNEISKSSGTTNNTWLTHPGFTFGETELNGFWVGKFEPSNSVNDIKIIPNVSSLRNINVASMFNASRNIETNTKYGLTSSEIDTHMMKNMEWGAVAYLSNSKYGRYISSTTCISSGCEIWINPMNYLTGCAGDSVSTTSIVCNQWNTATGVNASTTGNIYGIYDMSGGAWEYVMGNMSTSSGAYYPSSSGLSQPESKYYDSYAYGTSSANYSNGHLGDATKETRAWNGDKTDFTYSSYSWFGRGGSYSNGTGGGIFRYDSNPGEANANRTWRITLSKK